MKLITKVMMTLLCLITTRTLSAQDSSYTSFADRVFQHLDKSFMTTGILYDRSYPLASLHAFNSQADTVNTDWFSQAYFELYNAALNTSNLLNPDDLTYIRDLENFHGRVPLSVLDYRFNWLDTFAVEHNLITLQNGMYYDVQGRTQSPYMEKRIQMAAALYEKLAPGTITFSFPFYLNLNDAGLSVQQIQLSFPNIGTATLYPNATASLNFSSVGNHTGTITVTYTNGTSFTNTCVILTSIESEEGGNRSSRTMSPQGDGIAPCFSFWQPSTRTFQGYEENQAYPGRQLVNVYIRTSATCTNAQQQFNKPVIVLDGFDPTDKRDAKYIYNESFIYLDATGQPVNLAKTLRDDGYDVIIVDMPGYDEGTRTINTSYGPVTVARHVRGGGDYIERNALTLVDVIEYVKRNMPIDENIVICGPSMGGQISRYALRYMEKNGLSHRCSVWVSMDSPHEGAVISIGLQSFVKSMGAMSQKARDMVNNQLNVPAAKQQLLHHHLSNSESPVGAPGFHTRYYNLLNGLGWDDSPTDGKFGWPQLPRRVAVNSGAHNGLQQSGTSCSDAFWFKVRRKNYIRVLLVSTIGTNIEGSIRFSPSSSNGRCQVTDLKIRTQLGDIPMNKFATHSGMYDKSLDLLPGGWYPSFKELYDSLNLDSYESFAKVYKQLYFPNQTHIPTASALAYGKGPNPNSNRKWDDNVTSVNLSINCGTGEIPFHSYQGPIDFNTRHDLLFETQAQFLYNEITGRISSIPGLSISVPSTVCNNRPSYFTVSAPSGASVVWNTAPSGIVTLNPVSWNTVQATPIGAPSSSYTLYATVTASCVTTRTQTQVSFNNNPPPYNCYQVGNGTCTQLVYMCIDQFYAGRSFSIPNKFPDVPYWHWTVSGGTFSDGTTSQILPRYAPDPLVRPQWPNSSCQVYIRPMTECMVEDSYEPFKYVMINTNQSCYGYYMMSPNPASSDITVSTVENASQSKVDRGITSINIYSQEGTLKKEKKFAKVQTASISISGLANGMYIVEIISGDYKERKQLIVQH